MEVDDTEIKNTYTKWLEDGRFFLLPNAIFTLGLSPGEMTLYAYLIFCEDRKTHQCWPSIGRISCPLPAKIDRKKVKKTE